MSNKYEKHRFVRNNQFPKEMLCKFCSSILNDPIQCEECHEWFCLPCTEKKCSHDHENFHKFSEINKYMKNKINDLEIKCKYWVRGCLYFSKLSQIEKHEENCEFIECEEILSSINDRNRQLNIKLSCPFHLLICSIGCKKNSKNYEEKINKSVNWLLEKVEVKESQNYFVAVENEKLKKENEKLKEKLRKKRLNYEENLKNPLELNRELLKEVADIEESHKLAVNILKENNAPKMTIFHENSEDKIAYNWKKSEEDFENFSKKFKNLIEKFKISIKNEINTNMNMN